MQHGLCEGVGQMKYKIAIFDLDGTILDTLEDLKNSINFAVRHNGFAERTLDEVRQFVGNGLKKLAERAVPEGTPADKTAVVLETLNEHYALHCKDTTKPYAGIVEAINEIKKRGVKCAVVSNKSDYAVQPLCKFYYPDVFDSAVGVKDGIRAKPNPDAVLAIIKQFGGSKNETVYIGDSDVDVQTAKNAGVDCIAVLWGFRDKDTLVSAGAVNFAQNAKELEAYFAV